MSTGTRNGQRRPTQPSQQQQRPAAAADRLIAGPDGQPSRTQHPEIFAALSAPFKNEVKQKPGGGGRVLHYITARTAMNRLDNVLGPENWWDEYVPMEHSVLCKLSVRLPDGQVLTKCDAGGYAGMADQGDDDKSGFCLPLIAEALTPDGWKSYDELGVGAIVLGYDAAEGVCKWTSIRHITVFDEPCRVVHLQSKSFNMICTPNHRWAVSTRDKGVSLKETQDLNTRDKIINAAPAVGGGHPLTPREAAILGWLATDGSVSRGSRASEGRKDRQFHATIHQSKEPYRAQIRELLGDDAVEHVTPAGERTFPGHAVASLTRERSMFRLKNEFARALLAKAGIEQWSDLIRLAARLTVEARAAMFQAMLDADGHHSNSGQVVFGKKSKPGVMEAFEILATLQGVALGSPRMSSEGDMPIRTLRKLAHVHAKGIQCSPARPRPVWCPTTGLGTWVARWNGTITITGNSDAFKRAAAKFGVARHLYGDGVPEYRPTPPPPSNDTGHGIGAYARPEDVKAYQAWYIDLCERANSRYADWHQAEVGELPPKELLNGWQLSRHLLKHAVGRGLLHAPAEDDLKSRQVDQIVAVWWSRDADAVKAEAKAYLGRLYAERHPEMAEDDGEAPDDDEAGRGHE